MYHMLSRLNQALFYYKHLIQPRSNHNLPILFMGNRPDSAYTTSVISLMIEYNIFEA